MRRVTKTRTRLRRVTKHTKLVAHVHTGSSTKSKAEKLRTSKVQVRDFSPVTAQVRGTCGLGEGTR